MVILTFQSAEGAPIFSSPACPLPLDIVNRVNTHPETASEEANDCAPAVSTLVNANIPCYGPLAGSSFSLDPGGLRQKWSGESKVYFAQEQAARATSLGFNTTDTGAQEGKSGLASPSFFSDSNQRNLTLALEEKDLAYPENFTEETPLDFFRIAQDAQNDGPRLRDLFTAMSRSRDDGRKHVAAFNLDGSALSALNSPYFILVFEDKWFTSENPDMPVNPNSIVLVQLVGAPEPSLYLSIGSFLLAMLLLKRRRAAQMRRCGR